jgi:hypothetical protein
MTGFAADLDAMYANTTDLSQQRMGKVMDFILASARCQPVMLGAEDSSSSSTSLRWTAEEVSPMCNCLRNYHVEYIKAVRPNGVPLTPQQLDTVEMRVNITAIRVAVQDKCFKSVRATQVGVASVFF